MRVALILASIALATSAAAQSERQAIERYAQCNEREAIAIAFEPFPPYMLASRAAARCQAEEQAIADVMGRHLPEFRAMYEEFNLGTIKRARTEQLLAR